MHSGWQPMSVVLERPHHCAQPVDTWDVYGLWNKWKINHVNTYETLSHMHQIWWKMLLCRVENILFQQGIVFMTNSQWTIWSIIHNVCERDSPYLEALGIFVYHNEPRVLLIEAILLHGLMHLAVFTHSQWHCFHQVIQLANSVEVCGGNLA